MEVGSDSAIIEANLEDASETRVSLYDVMRTFKFNWRALALMCYGALTYTQFVIEIFLVTLAQASLWEHWPHLQTHRVQYNGCLAGIAFGRLAGNLFLSPLLDHYGRRTLIMFCNISSGICSLLSSWAGNFATYSVLRALSVFLAAPAGLAASAYIIELINPKWRTHVTMANQVISVLIISYVIGCKYWCEQMGWPAWQYLNFFSHIPFALSVIVGFIFYLEPPGFLLLEAKTDKAWRSIFRVAGATEIRRVPLREETDTPRVRASLCTILDLRPMLKGWVSMFGRSLRNDTLSMVIVWFCAAFCHWGIVSYCTLFYESVGFDANLMTFLSYVIQVPLQTITMLLTAKYKNEKAIIGIQNILTAAVTFTLAPLVHHATDSTAMRWFIAILAVSAVVLGSIMWGPIYAFSTERYPIKTRSSAMGLFSAVSAVSMLCSTYLGSIVITPGRIHILLYISGSLRVLVVFTAFFLLKTTVTQKIFDFQN